MIDKIRKIGGTLCIIFFILSAIAIPNALYKGYLFNKNIGSYCELSYEASDIHKKIEYFDTCLDLLKKENFQGHSVWWFKKPDNKLIELYAVADSLQLRMHNLESMKKDSFEYQKGLEQVEEEIAHFIGYGTLSDFSRSYCFKNTWTKYLC